MAAYLCGKLAKLLEQFKSLTPEQTAYLEKLGKTATAV